MPAHASPTRVIVIGAGITGLAAAHRLVELTADRPDALHITLLEAGDRLGGVIKTVQRDGFLAEAGPDNFITAKPAAIRLVERLGLADQVIRTNTQHRQALVVRNGNLVPIPEGFQLMATPGVWSLLTSPVFSIGGKLRMMREPFIAAKRDNPDEALASFVERRFGREALDRLIQPMIGGIYAADPKVLSLRATIPRFLEMEAQHGSIVRAMRKQAKRRRSAASAGSADKGARYSLFVTLREGLSTLVAKLAERIGSERIRTSARVAGIKPNGDTADGQPAARWSVQFTDGDTLPADHVILAAPAHHAADMLRTTDPALADQLAAIPYGSAAVANLAYRRDQIARSLDAFGFVVPHIEGRDLIAGSFSSVKYDGRAPEDHVLLRAFLGGALRPDVLQRDDEALRATAHREMADLLGITGDPLWSAAHRWPRAMAQYHVGHAARIAAIRKAEAKHAGLHLAGNAYEGVGIPDCTQSGEEAAQRMIDASGLPPP